MSRSTAFVYDVYAEATARAAALVRMHRRQVADAGRRSGRTAFRISVDEPPAPEWGDGKRPYDPAWRWVGRPGVRHLSRFECGRCGMAWVETDLPERSVWVPCAHCGWNEEAVSHDRVRGLLSEHSRDDGRCRVWTWHRNKLRGGYGLLSMGHVYTLAHRISYEVHCGPIPGGLWVLHACDNPPCINPRHLFVGTQADNITDSVLKQRHTYGEMHRWAKITEADAADIIASRDDGESIKSLAARFGLSRGGVHEITSGRTWKHLHARRI